MSILKEISNARLEFVKIHGTSPKHLIVCRDVLDKIKAALYQNSPVDPNEIPLARYDGMAIDIKEQKQGWTLSDS